MAKKPCLNNVLIWVRNKTKSEETDPVHLQCPRDGVVKDILQLMDIGHRDKVLITHCGEPLPLRQLLVQFDGKTTRENPIVLENCVVWVNENRTTRLTEYGRSDLLESLYSQGHSVILFDGKIQDGSELICNFRTTSENPLCIETLSEYIILPGNTPDGVYNLIHSPNTFGHVIAQLKIKYPSKNYQVKHLGKVVPCETQLDVAFLQPFMGKYSISLISDHMYDLEFSTNVSGSVGSRAKKQEVRRNLQQYPLFADNFTMKLHRYTSSDLEYVEFARGVQKILRNDSLCAQLRFPREKLPEETYTSILSSALQDFLKPVKHSCFHQCTLYDKSFPDFYVASMQSSLPEWPKLIGDFKKDSMDKAEVETFRYCLSMVNKSAKVYPLLAMPCTRKKFYLTLCVPEAEGKLAYIKIVEANVDDEDELAHFFAIMRRGVTSLEPRLFSNNPINPIEFKLIHGLTLSVKKKLNHRVFHISDDRVYKMYEGTLYGKPNKKLIVERLGADYLPHMDVTSLTDDNYFQMFSYDYLASKEYCPPKEKPKYFRDIAIAIDRLNAKGIVHSDIRLRNMLFLKDGRGKLIDFDLACKEDISYPDNYNDDFVVRHPDAKWNNPRKICHDKFSFLMVLITEGLIDKYFLNWTGELQSLPLFS